MADLNSHFQYPHYRRRFGNLHHNNHEPGASGAVHFANDSNRGTGVAESLYMDKVGPGLQQSRTAAALRRRGGFGLGAATHLSANPASIAASSHMPHGGPESGPGPAASVIGVGELAAAPSVVLGDSQGSVQLLHGQSPSRASAKGKAAEASSEGLAKVEGVASGLGESYVDGDATRHVGARDVQEEEESIEDGGVLGLLAQIYGRRDGPTVGI